MIKHRLPNGLIFYTTAAMELVFIGGMGICDQCGNKPSRGYLVPVLNQWMCQDCFDEWRSYCKHYPEDDEIERRCAEYFESMIPVTDDTTKYTEIFKLYDALTVADYPFSFRMDLFTCPTYQIICYDRKGNRICDAIEGYASIGGERDRLELMGLLTQEERQRDSVCGYLTADDVFSRVKNYMEENGQ